MSQTPHQIRFDDARRFLVDHALPFWATTGAYPNGCFVEQLDLAGRPVDPGFTRTRVQARQIYVYSHAQHQGLFAAENLLAPATDFFLTACWLGPERGWAKRIDRSGRLIDGSSDLYDTAFALFALAWRYRVAPEPRMLAIAHATLDFLDREMAFPNGGFRNDAAGSLPRQQNPHMHLTEAMTAWFEASADTRFADWASRLVSLMAKRFVDGETGALGEFFDADWSPWPGPEGNIVEPGHQFEWAWILAHYGRLTGTSRLDLVERLIGSGLVHGFDVISGLTIDRVGRDGVVLADSRRLWPQTEALKAMLAAHEFLGATEPDRIARIVDTILDRFLAPAPIPGLWIDHFDHDWHPIVSKIPASSLYHVALAFFELLRLRPTL